MRFCASSSRFRSVILPALLSCLALTPAVLRAGTIFEINANTPLGSQWKWYPKDAVVSTEGQTVMSCANPDAAAYAVTAFTTAAPSDQLNFTRNTVSIQLTDLSMTGSAAPDLQVFIIGLMKDKPSFDASSVFKVRMDATGGIGVWMTGTGDSPKPIWTSQLKWPIKKMNFTLSMRGVKIAIEDASGMKTQDLPWNDKPTAWEKAAPYLCFEAHRSPGPGDLKATIGSVKIESTAGSK